MDCVNYVSKPERRKPAPKLYIRGKAGCNLEMNGHVIKGCSVIIPYNVLQDCLRAGIKKTSREQITDIKKGRLQKHIQTWPLSQPKRFYYSSWFGWSPNDFGCPLDTEERCSLGVYVSEGPHIPSLGIKKMKLQDMVLWAKHACIPERNWNKTTGFSGVFWGKNPPSQGRS